MRYRPHDYQTYATRFIEEHPVEEVCRHAVCPAVGQVLGVGGQDPAGVCLQGGGNGLQGGVLLSGGGGHQPAGGTAGGLPQAQQFFSHRVPASFGANRVPVNLPDSTE